MFEYGPPLTIIPPPGTALHLIMQEVGGGVPGVGVMVGVTGGEQLPEAPEVDVYIAKLLV